MISRIEALLAGAARFPSHELRFTTTAGLIALHSAPDRARELLESAWAMSPDLSARIEIGFLVLAHPAAATPVPVPADLDARLAAIDDGCGSFGGSSDQKVCRMLGGSSERRCNGQQPAMARRSFAETFGHLYEPGSFRDFLDQAYGPDGIMASDLLDPEVRWLAGFLGAEPVGYAKLTPLRAPAATPLPGALELQQIYVLSDWHGLGLADRLMSWALETAASGSGYGLAGMRERVEALGGKVRAGPLPGAGWAVQASLPVPAQGPR